MATFTIAGNVAGSVAGEIVYCISRHVSYAVTNPNQQTVTDGSGNYSFTVNDGGKYFLYTAKAPLSIQKVVVNGANFAGINFAS